MRKTSPSDRSRWSRWSFSGSVAQPTNDRPKTGGHLAQLVRAGRNPTGLAASSDEIRTIPRDRHAFGGLERQQSSHRVADDHGRGAEPLERRYDILGVGLE